MAKLKPHGVRCIATDKEGYSIQRSLLVLKRWFKHMKNEIYEDIFNNFEEIEIKEIASSIPTSVPTISTSTAPRSPTGVSVRP